MQSTLGQQAQGLPQLKIENAKMNSNKNLSGETKAVANLLDAVDAGVQAFGLVTVAGATNAWLGGATKAEDIALGAGIAVESSVVGGVTGQVSSKYIGGILINGMKVSSPILQGTIKGVIGGSVGGYTSGLSVGLILTGDWEVAHEYGWKGALTGAISGIDIVLGIILILGMDKSICTKYQMV